MPTLGRPSRWRPNRSPRSPRSSGAHRRCGPSLPPGGCRVFDPSPYFGGSIPTDAGYRCYVELLLDRRHRPSMPGMELGLSRLRREIDEAMRETTTALAQVTDLMALGDGATAHDGGDYPPDRGVPAPGGQGDGDRDCFNRRRCEASVRFRSAGRPGLDRVGVELSERVAGRDERRCADDCQPARRSRLGPG